MDFEVGKSYFYSITGKVHTCVVVESIIWFTVDDSLSFRTWGYRDNCLKYMKPVESLCQVEKALYGL